MQRGLRNGLILGGLALIGIVALNARDLAGLGTVLAAFPLALAASLASHLPQLLFTGLAWLALLPAPQRPRIRRILLLRWYREACDSLVPAGAVVGQAAVTRLMIRDGMPADLAAGTATLGITLEAVSQMLFTLLGLATFLALGHATEATGFWIGAGVAAVTAVALVALQRPWALGLLRRVLERLSRRWPRLEPVWLDRFQESLLRLHEDRKALVLSTLSHLGSWMMGAVEMFLLLNITGFPVTFAEALVIESFAQVIRSAGFLLPGAALVQEGAIVAAGALIGVPPGIALNAALIRRTREILVGLSGLGAWRRDEARGRRTT
ncbi:lysylphosphatidylglycerol synthase domain-containing protein [Roseococcus sp.]|uniref:lysylphosphatidylglycerol synthase domain-containing protein n=1 Tax=Roseococcus sp. TaxID=2109646 RepID=UPI003BABF74A